MALPQGVKGRPQACVTCHRRKKGCDLQRPSCGQCRKACIPCGGYVRKKAALDSKPLTWQPREYGSQTPEPSSLPTPPDSTNDRHRHLQRLRHRLGSTDLITSGPVSRSAEHDRLIGTFWEAFLPNSEPFPPGTFQITLGGSVDDIKKLSQNNSTLHKGLLAIALTTLGKRTSSSWMKEEGFRLYGEALKSMSQSLRPDKWTTDQMVVTRLFSVYEALHGADAKRISAQGESWKVHSSGDGALITSRAPSTYITGVSHHIFSAGRHHLALLAIMARKRCFLAEPQWKHIPWTIMEKTPRDLLLDIVVDLPGILEAADAMSTWTGGKKEAYRGYIYKAIRAYITRLLAWAKTHATPLYPPTLNAQLPELISASQLADGHIMSIYYSILLRVHSLSLTLQCPETRINPDDSCTKIVTIIRIFLHPSAGMFRQYITPFPMSTALQYLIKTEPGRMGEEKKRLFTDMETPAGKVIKDFILSIEPA